MRRAWACMMVVALLASCSSDNEEATPAPVAVTSVPVVTEPAPTPEVVHTPLTVLVIGSDTRDDNGPDQWKPGAQRADVIMVLRANEQRTEVTGVSIPRDSWTEIPGHGKN